jgi:beta-glucanase (GH16 family)
MKKVMGRSYAVVLTGFLVFISGCGRSTTQIAAPSMATIKANQNGLPQNFNATTNAPFLNYNQTIQDLGWGARTITFNPSLSSASLDWVVMNYQQVTKKSWKTIRCNQIKSSYVCTPEAMNPMGDYMVYNFTYKANPPKSKSGNETVITTKDYFEANYSLYTRDNTGSADTRTFTDDFDSMDLNSSKWSADSGAGPNGEAEYYTDINPPAGFGKNIVMARTQKTQADGTIKLSSSLLLQGNKVYDTSLTQGQPYTSGRVVTRGHASFSSGRFDIRAKLPKTYGTWPAIWLLSDKLGYWDSNMNQWINYWPSTGEIDIMEAMGKDPAQFSGSVVFNPRYDNKSKTPLVFTNAGDSIGGVHQFYELQNGLLNDDFHVFSLEWAPDSLRYLIDGQVYSTVTPETLHCNNSSCWPYNDTSFYLILNLALGGGGQDNSRIDAGSLNSDAGQFFIDYVHVYKNRN